MPWDLMPLRHGRTEPESRILKLGWGHAFPLGELTHSIFISANTTMAHYEDSDLLPLQMRIMSHYLVDHLPDESLPELLESVQEMIHFYVEGAAQENLLESKPVTLAATISRTYARPESPAVED